jgi:hypothetical protein
VIVDRQLWDLYGRRLRFFLLDCTPVRTLGEARAQYPRGPGGSSGGLTANGTRVGEQLVERPVAHDPAGRQHVVG